MRAQISIAAALLFLSASASLAQKPTPQAPTKQPPVARPAITQDVSFALWLNRQRAARGLRPVAVDPVLNYDCYVNNTYQVSRGLGHYYMGHARRQNVGVGGQVAVWQAWIASPPHASALFDPTVTRIGYDYRGGYETYDGR